MCFSMQIRLKRIWSPLSEAPLKHKQKRVWSTSKKRHWSAYLFEVPVWNYVQTMHHAKSWNAWYAMSASSDSIQKKYSDIIQTFLRQHSKIIFRYCTLSSLGLYSEKYSEVFQTCRASLFLNNLIILGKLNLTIIAVWSHYKIGINSVNNVPNYNTVKLQPLKCFITPHPLGFIIIVSKYIWNCHVRFSAGVKHLSIQELNNQYTYQCINIIVLAVFPFSLLAHFFWL